MRTLWLVGLVFCFIWNSIPIEKMLGPESTLRTGSLGFTLIVATYSGRYTVFQDFLRRYGQPGFAYCRKILVLWNDLKYKVPAPAEAELRALIHPSVALEIIEIKNGTMDSRFCYTMGVEENTVLLLDDDIRMPTRVFSAVYRMIKRKGWRNQVVGFGPRHYSVESVGFKYRFGPTEGRWSMILPSAFYPTTFLRSYCENAPQTARNVVKLYPFCDDIALNYFRASIGLWPYWVRCRLQAANVPGISTEPDYPARRCQCLSYLTGAYGRMVLSDRVANDSLMFNCPVKG